MNNYLDHQYCYEYLFTVYGYWVYRVTFGNTTVQFETRTPTKSFTDTAIVTCFNNLEDLINYALSHKREGD